MSNFARRRSNCTDWLPLVACPAHRLHWGGACTRVPAGGPDNVEAVVQVGLQGGGIVATHEREDLLVALLDDERDERVMQKLAGAPDLPIRNNLPPLFGTGHLVSIGCCGDSTPPLQLNTLSRNIRRVWQEN